MEGIPYADWFAFIRRFLTAQTLPLLELFAGPARIAGLAHETGFTAFALDKEAAYFKAAARAAFGLVADASDLPFMNASIGCIVSANSSIHYLRDYESLKNHFAECRRVLHRRGVYIFDCCPPERAAALSGKELNATTAGIRFAHRYQSAAQLLETTVSFTARPGITELHRQYIFTAKEISDAATNSGFQIKERVANYGLKGHGFFTPVETWVISADND